MKELKGKIILPKVEKPTDTKGWREYCSKAKPAEETATKQLSFYVSTMQQHLCNKYGRVDRPSFLGEAYFRYGEKQKILKFYKMENVQEDNMTTGWNRGEVVGILIIDYVYK